MNRFIVVLATIAHLIPHPFGVSSVGATALYAGAFGPRRFSWAVPLLPLFVGNVVFGFYDARVLASVYVGFALSALVGRRLLATKRNYPRYAAAVGLGATIFFIVTNFANWVVFYPHTFADLILCYVNGLPYFGQAALADAAYCFVLFGLHSLINQQKAAHVLA